MTFWLPITHTSILHPPFLYSWSFGPEGVLALREGPEASGTIGGMMVVESRRLDLSRTEGPTEPFLKTIRHGEFYPVVDENAQDEHNGYSSAWRNITVWDEQATQYVKLTLRDAITYSGRWKPSGELDDTHDKLAHEPVSAGMLEYLPGTYPGANPYMVSRSVQMLTADRLASEFRDMFLYKRDGESGYGVTHYFGLMETYAATPEDFRMVARTVAQSCFGQEWEATKGILEDLQELVARSESIPYNGAWWVATMQANMNRQASNPPQTTNAAVAAHRREPPVQELMPNEYGGMDLPARSLGFQDYSVPPHTNSWPALRTLAAQRNTGLGWEDAAQIAASACAVITRLAKKAAEVFGSSVFLHPLNRQPWFQQANSETVLTSEIILAPRDGVFMRMLANDALIDAADLAVPARATTAAAAASVVGSIKGNWAILAEIVEDAALMGADPGPYGVMGALYDMLPADKAELMVDLLLAIATDNINPKAWSDTECKTARCRARRLIRQAAAAASAGKDDAARAATLSTLVDMLAPIMDTKATAAQLKAAEQFREQTLRQPSRNAVMRGGLIVIEQKVITEAEDDAAPVSVVGLTNWAKFKGGRVAAGGTTIATPAPSAAPAAGPVVITAEQWDAGFWVRVPLNSYRVFAETAMQQAYPLALPSNPELRHLAPVEPSALGTGGVTRILQRPQYTVSAQKNTEAELSASAVLEAMELVDIPEDVWSKASPGAAAAAVAASRKRSAAQSELTSAPLLDAATARRPQPALTQMLAAIVNPDTKTPYEQATYHPMEGRDRESRDRRAEYARWTDEHSQSYGDRANTEYLAGGGGRAVTEAAMRYSRFESKWSELRRDFNQSVFVNRWKRGSMIADPVVRFFHQVFLGARIILQQMWDMIDNHVHIPINAIVWRLFITRSK